MAAVQARPSAADAAPAAANLSGVDKDALITRLDTLLEQYLHTLDEYEKLAQQLSKQLSSGYFSLTQANFHNRSGVQYGQDSYDERVQATRKVLVTEDERCSVCFETFSTSAGTPSNPETESHLANDEKKDEEKTEQREKDESIPAPAAGDADNGGDEKTEPAKSTVVDPIRMFGILVPPALRSAQASFAEAVDGPVMRLAEVTGELRALEREIGRTRKSIRKA